MDIFRAHTKTHVDQIKRNSMINDIAILAAGGAIKAAELAYNKQPTFALIRPPGHHASGNSCWGFCYYNNMAIALLKLIEENKIKSAFILDFDLHTGDGTINILGHLPTIHILNPNPNNEFEYIKTVKDSLESLNNVNII